MNRRSFLKSVTALLVLAPKRANLIKAFVPKKFLEPAEINLRISGSDIVAKSRKLKATWSVEAAEDLKAYHGIWD